MEAGGNQYYSIGYLIFAPSDSKNYLRMQTSGQTRVGLLKGHYVVLETQFKLNFNEGIIETQKYSQAVLRGK